MRILIIDDEQDMLFLIERHLRKHGECDTADGGVAGIESFRNALAAQKPYALVTCDINMPDMSGHETIIKIREIEDEAGVEDENRVRVIMLSSSTESADIQQSFSEQSSAYIVKPITKEKVNIVLKNIGIIGDDTPPDS